jgi:hypothetical protein
MKKTYNVPAELTPISMWGYFGYSILFNIPVVGFIFLIIFAIGAKNVNKKNFARSYFCGIILALIIIGIAALISGATGGFAALASFIQQNIK